MLQDEHRLTSMPLISDDKHESQARPRWTAHLAKRCGCSRMLAHVSCVQIISRPRSIISCSSTLMRLASWHTTAVGSAASSSARSTNLTIQVGGSVAPCLAAQAIRGAIKSSLLIAAMWVFGKGCSGPIASVRTLDRKLNAAPQMGMDASLSVASLFELTRSVAAWKTGMSVR